jgi:predicted transcriptional regulator
VKPKAGDIPKDDDTMNKITLKEVNEILEGLEKLGLLQRIGRRNGRLFGGSSAQMTSAAPPAAGMGQDADP